MDKYILNDGTTVEIEESNSTYSFTKKFANAEEYLSTLQSLKKGNLRKFKQMNAAGMVCATPENKECVSHMVRTDWDSKGNITAFTVTFNISDVNMVNERLAAAEETLDVLVSDYLGVEGVE